MYRIKTMNKIASAGLDQLDKSRFQVGEDVENEDGILVRSAKMHDYVFPDALRAIARAGAGTNNIPIDRCSESGIVVFNTPGANANAVKELVIAALLIASRDIVGGVDWVQEQAHTPNVDVAAAVEKGKSAFVGPELYRKTLGVIGLGAIGALVCNIGLDLGMDVYGYDPYLSVDAALRLDRHAENTQKVVEYLVSHPLVEKVNHPSLPDHPDHALYLKYFPNGGASIFTFEIRGGKEQAWQFIDGLDLFSLLANVADVKSLVIHPATTTHSQLTEEELLDVGIKPNTIRLSIGTEHIDDIIADLEKGFAQVK